MEYRASLLAGHGFATLALAYYDFDDLPKKFDVIRLEYFEEALCYMLQHTQVLLLSFILLFRTTSRGAVAVHSPVPGARCCSALLSEIAFGDFLGFSA